MYIHDKDMYVGNIIINYASDTLNTFTRLIPQPVWTLHVITPVLP